MKQGLWSLKWDKDHLILLCQTIKDFNGCLLQLWMQKHQIGRAHV